MKPDTKAPAKKADERKPLRRRPKKDRHRLGLGEEIEDPQHNGVRVRGWLQT